MKDLKLYELNSSQEVVMLQCKYTLFKKVVNIVTSISYKKELDFELLNKAYNLVVSRNDSLRIRFTKVKGKTMQYFLNDVDETKVPVHSFNTKEEQEKFIKQITKRAIKYKKGVVIEPYFVHTYDDKYMVVLKVCHLVLDIYGINVSKSKNNRQVESENHSHPYYELLYVRSGNFTYFIDDEILREYREGK